MALELLLLLLAFSGPLGPLAMVLGGDSVNVSSGYTLQSYSGTEAVPSIKKVDAWTPSQPDPQNLNQNPFAYSSPGYQASNYFLPGMYHQPSPTPIQTSVPQPPIQPPTPAPPPPPQPAPQQQPSGYIRSEYYPPSPYDQVYPYYGLSPQPLIDNSMAPTSRHFVVVAFIGLLLLFAIIQNSLMAAVKRKAELAELTDIARMRRRKRELIVADGDFSKLGPEEEAMLNDDARVRCIQKTLCLENRKLQEDLGFLGFVLAKYLTLNVKKSLKESAPGGWTRLVEDAANAGLRGEDCDVVYRACNSPM